MTFTQYFNYLYSKLNCTQNDLCNASNLSAPVISRYLSGDREPSPDSDQLNALAQGLHTLAVSRHLGSHEFDYDNLIKEFNRSLEQKNTTYNAFVVRFNNIINSFDINMKDLANALSFDVSYLYRIKSGERRPGDLDKFCELVSDYISNVKTDKKDFDAAAKLFSCNVDKLKNSGIYKKTIYLYLTEATDNDIPEMSSFLSKIEEFNLDEYITAIHFDELKVPNIPFHFPSSKYYYGTEEMRKAELDFLKATVLGKSKENVFMCSYIPLVEMAEDKDFSKKWMFGIAMMIKKGLHLNVIHNLNRPMNELMLGFEAWIPIYMTGQVSPYHIPEYDNSVFHQINYCSGSAALMGECIDGYFNDGRYYVTNSKSEIAYFRKKANALLKNAKPLMDIYTADEYERFSNFLKKNISVKNDMRFISSSLPDFTLPEEILEKHLANVDSKEKDRIISYIKKIRSFANEMMKTNILTYDVCEITKEEYEKNPVRLTFSLIFSDFEAILSYDEYIEHLCATKEYAASRKNFKLHYVEMIPFKNIKISIVSGKYFLISKAKCPSIHFVIYHKKMLAGMENFYLAYKE